MDTVFIYYLHRGNNVPFYIGKTVNLLDRLREHKNIKGKCFIEVLEEVQINEWIEKEKFYIKKYIDLGYMLINQNLGGGGSKIGTKKHTKESKEKLKTSRLGKKLSEETKNKIYTIDRNKKISESLKGRIFHKEHLEKLSKAKMNKVSNASKPILQFDLKENFIKEWSSITKAKKWLGKGDIQGCVLGKQKTSGGYIWKFKN
jgi:hypothetical protein